MTAQTATSQIPTTTLRDDSSTGSQPLINVTTDIPPSHGLTYTSEPNGDPEATRDPGKNTTHRNDASEAPPLQRSEEDPEPGMKMENGPLAPMNPPMGDHMVSKELLSDMYVPM